MQPNTITLSVDEDNDGGTTASVDHVYDRYDEYQNRTVYSEAGHTPGARDQMTLYRTFPKENGNFRGVQKTSLKFTKDTVVDGADGLAQITAPAIAEASFSFPVGMTLAEQKTRRMVLATALLNDDVCDDLTYKQSV